MAPIIVFAFNRPDSLQRAVEALAANEEAKESDLYVFVDGPRPHKEGEAAKVEAVREYAKNIKGFRSLTCSFAETNKGLAPSIISGVSQVIQQHGRAIVAEDDLVVSPNFLAFMNQALDRYAGDQRVFSVCGYSNKVSVPATYEEDAYFCVRSSSWGWATWTDRWQGVDWELPQWDNHRRRARAFNRWGGSDCWKMLNDWHEGRNKSWAIRFCYAQFRQNALALFPIESKVRNDGFDGGGTNCKRWSRFRCQFDTKGSKDFRLPDRVEMHPQLYKSAMKYHSIPLRAWSKIMYIVHR